MHNGRLFPQLTDRWACPDFETDKFAPRRIRARLSVTDIFGSFYNAFLDSEFGSVDLPTGRLFWTFLGVTWGPYTDWVGTIRQDACGRPDTRRFLWSFAHATDRLEGELLFTEMSGRGDYNWRLFGGAPSLFPRTTLSIGPIRSWTIQKIGGVPYY
jgi:hypothetical protein